MHPGRLSVLPLVQNKVAPFAVAQKRHGVVGICGDLLMVRALQCACF